MKSLSESDQLEDFVNKTLEIASSKSGVFGPDSTNIPPEISADRSDDELQKANLTLENLIEVRTLELENEEGRHVKTQTALAASQRLDSIGKLTGGVAHDFNNIMAVILGNAELLELEFSNTEKATINIDAIKSSVSRGIALTRRLLAFARETILEPRVANIDDLIEGMSDSLARTLGVTVKLEIEEGSESWNVMIDPHQFEDALINLATNARDAMPNGGVLTIDSRNISVPVHSIYALGYLEPGDYVEIKIADTGNGISAANLEKVIEPFFTTKEFGKGIGLGLSMVYGFALQSKGHFGIESELGLGTKVTLYLPRTTISPSEKPDIIPSSRLQADSECILVVEDDHEVLRICASVLKNNGFNVIEAANGKEAISHLLSNQRIDLLFTDIILPGDMNGAEIAVVAKAMRKDIKIIYTTGYSELSSIEHLVLDPDIIRINKPYPREELLEKISAVMNT